MGVSDREELDMASSFPFCPVNRECHVKENPDRKKNILFWIVLFESIFFQECLESYRGLELVSGPYFLHIFSMKILVIK